MLTSKDTLIDLMDAYKRGVHAALKDLPQEALVWQPDDEANHIAVTIWHLGRVMDSVKAVRMEAADPSEQLWFKEGWAEKYDYDPRGIGDGGTGILTGYSVEEMLAVPVMSAEDMQSYFDQCFQAVYDFLEKSTSESLQENSPGSERKFYFWVKICIIDGTRHTGELLALRSMWERKNK
ncbi:MAG: DinB family protein [Chloroflexi bacterium]|nr:DinB family protein [Chloroflexota bacterium]